jgi:hypothetical protein
MRVFLKTTGSRIGKMSNHSSEKHIKLWTPATYHIEVQGHLDEAWSCRLAGMCISTSKISDQTTVTTLIGRLRDQAELSGVLNSLYDLHLSILKVEAVNSE